MFSGNSNGICQFYYAYKVEINLSFIIGIILLGLVLVYIGVVYTGKIDDPFLKNKTTLDMTDSEIQTFQM